MATSILTLSRPVITKAPRAAIGSENFRSWRASPSSACSRSDGAGIAKHAPRLRRGIVNSSRQRRRAAVVHVAMPPQRLGGSYDERSISAAGEEGSSTSGGDVYSNVVSPPVVVVLGGGGGGGVPAEEENMKRETAEEEREKEEMSRRGGEGVGAGATAHQQEALVPAEVYDVMEGMPPQMLAAMRGDVEGIAAMDLADAVAAENHAKRALTQQTLRACNERSALAQQALRESDERLAAILSKHERIEAEIQTRAAGRSRGTLVTVRARPEEDADGAGGSAELDAEHHSDVLLAMELAEAAAAVETALCTVERSRLEDELAAAHEKIAAAEAFAETLAKNMEDAVADAAACRRQTSEANRRLAAAVDERAEKVSELLEEIDHWHEVATRAQEGENHAREELEKVRAELEAAVNVRTGESMRNDDAEQRGDPSTRGDEPIVAGTEAEAEDEELNVLKRELEEAKKAAAAADEDMAELRREAEAAAAAVKDAVEGPAEGELEEARAAANAAAGAAFKAVDGAVEKLREAEERAGALRASVEEKDGELRAIKKQLKEANEASSKSSDAAVEASHRLHELEAEAEAAKLAAAAAALCVAKEMMTKMRERGVKF